MPERARASKGGWPSSPSPWSPLMVAAGEAGEAGEAQSHDYALERRVCLAGSPPSLLSFAASSRHGGHPASIAIGKIAAGCLLALTLTLFQSWLICSSCQEPFPPAATIKSWVDEMQEGLVTLAKTASGVTQLADIYEKSQELYTVEPNYGLWKLQPKTLRNF